MSIKDFATVTAYHGERISRFGSDACEALGWKNSSSQSKRFEHLLQLGGIEGSSVLDLGCGHGDLYPFLRDRFGSFQYIGVDSMSSFLDVAVSRFSDDPNVRFLLGEFASVSLPIADFVVCCGALNYRQSDADYLNKMIERFYGLSSKCLVLSLLHRVDHTYGVLTPSDPEQVWNFCRNLSSLVEIQMDEGEDFFTVAIYREE